MTVQSAPKLQLQYRWGQVRTVYILCLHHFEVYDLNVDILTVVIGDSLTIIGLAPGLEISVSVYTSWGFEGKLWVHIADFVVKQLDSIEFYKMNLLNESLSMNVFWMQGMAFIPDKTEPEIDRESDASTYTWVHCLDIIFKMGDMLTLLTMLDNLTSRLAYIYSII
jgi:hypothetical protein